MDVHFHVVIGLTTTTLLAYTFNGKHWVWDEDYLSLAEAERKYPKDDYNWTILED